MELAERYRDAHPGTGILASHLRLLAEATGELAAFMVVRGTEAVCVEAVESRHTLRASYSVGAAVPLLRGATATALLSRMPPAARGSILEHYNVPAAQRADIESACAQAQADGYAVSTGELDPGIWGVSVPVPDGRGQLAGTLTLMAPSERSGHREEELIELVRGTADALSEGMQ
ncbi:hypothetical protein GCM10009715_32490 [Paeniglutamicibacter psychrophenolicus]